MNNEIIESKVLPTSSALNTQKGLFYYHAENCCSFLEP